MAPKAALPELFETSKSERERSGAASNISEASTRPAQANLAQAQTIKNGAQNDQRLSPPPDPPPEYPGPGLAQFLNKPGLPRIRVTAKTRCPRPHLTTTDNPPKTKLCFGGSTCDPGSTPLYPGPGSASEGPPQSSSENNSNTRRFLSTETRHRNTDSRIGPGG
jgi:hypothetical protein